MASGQIRMTPSQMRTRAKEADKQAQAVGDVITALDNLLKNLKGEWEGEALVGYEQRYNKIKPSFKNAKELVEEIAANLRTTAKIVEDMDRQIKNQYTK